MRGSIHGNSCLSVQGADLDDEICSYVPESLPNCYLFSGCAPDSEQFGT